MAVAAYEDQTAWQDAERILDADPLAGQKLLDSLRENMRPISKQEHAVLLREKAMAIDEVDKALRRRVASLRGDSSESPTTLENELEIAKKRRDALDELTSRGGTGTEAGRALQARKMTVDMDDWSLVRMTMEKEDALDRPLNDKETLQVAQQAERIKELEQAYAKQQERIVELERNQKLQPFRKPRSAKARAELDAVWTDVLSHWKGTTTFSNPLPQAAQLFSDGVRLAKAYAKLRMSNVADFLAVVRERIGQERFDETKDIWSKAWEQAIQENEAEAEKQTISRLTKKKAEIEDKLARKDFTVKIKIPRKISSAVEHARFDLEEAQRQFKQGLKADRDSRRSLPRKALSAAWAAPDVLKSLNSSVDISAVGRQGFLLGMGHPVEAIKAFGTMFRAAVSKRQESAILHKIKSSPNAHWYRRYKLLMEPGTHDEYFPSKIVSRIPLVGASERAYRMYLTRLRTGVFDVIMRQSKGRELDAAATANFVDVFSGRGALGDFEQAAMTLNKFFYSPRSMASRVQVLAGQPFYQGDAQTRAMVAKEYARTVTGILTFGSMAVAGLYGAFGPPGKDKKWDFEFDLHSWRGFRIRIGRSWIDPWAGMQQVVRLVYQLGTGKVAKESGRLVSIRGKVSFGEKTPGDLVAQRFRSYLSPGMGAAWSGITQTNYRGEPTTLGEIAKEAILPITPMEIYKALRAEGYTNGAALGAMSAMGIGVTTPEPPDARRIKAWRKDVKYTPHRQPHESLSEFRQRLIAARIDAQYAREQLRNITPQQ